MVGYAVGTSIICGGAVGGVVAWAFDRSVATGVLGGVGAGAVFGILLGAIRVWTAA